MDLGSWEVFENVFSDSIFETSSEVHSLASSENYICAGLRSGQIWVLDLNTSDITILKSHTNTVNSLFIIDNTLISGGQDTSILIWDLTSSSKVGQIPAHDGIITGFSALPPFLYSSSIDQTVKCFDYTTVCKLYELRMDTVVCCIKATNEKVYLGCEDGTIEITLLDLTKIGRFEGHFDAVWCIDVYLEILVSCSFDGSIRVWDCETGIDNVIGEHEGVVNKIGIFDPSNTGIPLIVSVGSDKVIKLWALDGVKDVWKYHTDSVSSVVILDMFVVTAGFDKKIRMWSLMNNLKMKKVVSFENTVQDFALVQNNMWVVENEKIMKNGENWGGVKGKVQCISEDYNKIFVGVEETLQVFDAESGEMVEKWELGVLILRVISKDKEILVCGKDKCFFIGKDKSVEQLAETGSCGDFSVDSIVLAGQQIKVLNRDYTFNCGLPEPASSIIISRNNTYIYTGTSQGVSLYLLSPLTPLCKISIYQPITQLKLHPQSFILASTSKSIILLPEYDLEKQIMLP
jgi:WD40 repeat protein